ncbi:cupin domain-containing protein [Oceanibacterium hippocampi]|uniref:Cupin domain protein n=1 Tax=Oceanibacterium hippocampi TaxID=745714 RepID=A0A1Y5RBD6_9PROT|nr:AraC family ligand binding domain-containing protein [Oceanibacterium hippocampi]SLN13144.1 Cupin domain protein [Oceanibacterium hippocampi]
MTELKANFVDVSNGERRENEEWPALVVPRAEIDREIERLADIDRPAHGRRASKVVHPMARVGQGLAPGIDVTINVLKPGEETAPIRHNSSQVTMCIAGSGKARIGDRDIAFGRYDLWTTPGLATYRYRNDGPDLQVFFSYSNAPLLELLEVHYVEDEPSVQIPDAAAPGNDAAGKRARDSADDIPIGSDGARLRGYEFLIDPDVVPNPPLLFPWQEVESRLSRVAELGKDYTGRRLYLLYNPATLGRNGTTHSFFATIAKYPPNTVDQPHRHASAAINYYFAGNGRSTVAGRKFVWEAGDLMLSAPGWAVHNHASRDQGFYALTVQDHPMHIAADSLIWQETLKAPIVNLGSQYGAQTNRAELAAAR